MMPPEAPDRVARIQALAQNLTTLSDSQLAWMEGVLKQFAIEPELYRNPASDLVSDCVLTMFGDALQIHHCFSSRALSKDNFEHTLDQVLNQCGIYSALAKRGNPGHDITIRGVPFSLKTQADKGIRKDFLHVSKAMELGKGDWFVEQDLIGLRDRFFKHLESYERILQLRRITDLEDLQEYELVEIPKALLLKAKDHPPEMVLTGRQTPKPGRCTVTDNERRLFELYFDGGTERKLQIRHLRKDSCQVHAQWSIKRIPPSTTVA